MKPDNVFDIVRFAIDLSARHEVWPNEPYTSSTKQSIIDVRLNSTKCCHWLSPKGFIVVFGRPNEDVEILSRDAGNRSVPTVSDSVVDSSYKH